MRLPEQILEVADPDEFDHNVYIDRIGGSAQDAIEKWLRQAGFLRTHQQRSSRVVTYQKRIGYRFISLTRTLDSIGGTFDPIWSVGHYSPHMKHAGVRQSNLRAFIVRLMAGDTEAFNDAALIAESTDPDDFDHNVYVDRYIEQAKSTIGPSLIAKGCTELADGEFVYGDLRLTRRGQGIDPVWEVQWSSWHQTWPEPAHRRTRVYQSKLVDFITEFQTLLDTDYAGNQAFELVKQRFKWARGSVAESADPDDPASFMSRVENPEHVLRELGFVKHHQSAWVREDGNLRTVVEQSDPLHWRVKSWLVGSKHSVVKDYDWFDLRAGIEWALPRTAKWAQESADPDDINPQRYLKGVRAKPACPRCNAERTVDDMGADRKPCFYCQKCGRPFWERDVFRSYVCDSADPDDINPQHYLDGLSTHELLDTSTPASSSRSTCCTCGKWCFSGLVRDEAERQDFENNLRTEWERHRAFATERVEPESRDYMLRVGEPYRWGESSDPDDFDPQRYVAGVSVPIPVWAEFVLSCEEAPSVSVDARDFLETRSKKWLRSLMAFESGSAQSVGVSFGYSERDLALMSKLRLPEEFYVYIRRYQCGGMLDIDRDALERWWAERSVRESTDPDDFDPKRYVDEVSKDRMMLHAANFRQVSKDRWERQRLHTTVDITNMGGSGWMLTVRGHAWSSSTQYMTLHGAIYANTELRESADPDDINPDLYLDALPAPVWVIKWKDSYYEAHSNSHGQFAGGEWKLKPDHATRWLSQDVAQSFFERNLRPWYPNAEVVPVQRRLSEAADPDDVSPQRYLDDEKWRHLLRSYGFVQNTLNTSHPYPGVWIKFVRMTGCTYNIDAKPDGFHVWVDTPWGTGMPKEEVLTLKALEKRLVAAHLNESADPDDINPEHYLDAVAATAGPQELRARLKDAFRGSFMQPEYFFGGFHEVETNAGTYIVPADVMDSDDPDDYVDYVEGRITGVSERREGWVYRTSASGYMDASDWGAAASEEEAIEELIDNYGGQGDELEEAADPDDVDPSRYLSGVVPPVEAMFTLDDGEGTSVRVDAADYLNKRPNQWMKNLRIHASLSGTPAVGVDFEYSEPDLAAMSLLRLPAEVYTRMREYECGGVLEIDRDSLERWWARRHVKESADPDDVDPKQWLDSIALSRDRVREIIRGIPQSFHIGFSIHTSDESMVEANADGDGIELTDEIWTALLNDIDLIEGNVCKWMDAHKINNRSEGHAGDCDLVGSIFLDLAVPSNFAFFAQYMQHEEPWSTSSGTFPHDVDVYADTSEFSHLLDVDLDLFDYAECQATFEEMEGAGVTLKLLNGVWTGVSPARDVEEAADPDEPNMARWVERLSAETLLDRLFGVGMPLFRDNPRVARRWENMYQFGLIGANVSYTLYYTGTGAPSALFKYEVKQGRKKLNNDELVFGPDTILRQVELLVQAIESLETSAPKTLNDVALALQKPANVRCSFNEHPGNRLER